MKVVTPAIVTTGPLLMDLWGVDVPVLSMIMGLTSVVLVRIMLMSKEFKNEKGFWFYNIPLTLLMVFIAFAVIADRQLSPGISVMVGTGIGASGMVLVDLLKDRVQNIIHAALGKGEDNDP